MMVPRVQLPEEAKREKRFLLVFFPVNCILLLLACILTGNEEARFLLPSLLYFPASFRSAERLLRSEAADDCAKCRLPDPGERVRPVLTAEGCRFRTGGRTGL